jgi:hypothetical protein
MARPVVGERGSGFSILTIWGLGARTVAPNVFKGEGFAGSISIVDSETGEVLRELVFLF